jgi:PAS domain S-box-containing protein
MFEGVRLSTLLIDLETEGIIYCNSHAEEWLGFSRDDYVEKDRALDIVVEKDRGRVQEVLDVAAKDGKSQFCEISFVTKDDSVRIGEMNAATIKYQGKSVVQVTIRDITERKEMEEKLLRSEKLKALGELAGGVAHDFNNVLSAILGRAQLLKTCLNAGEGKAEGESIGEVAKGLEIIEKAALDGGDTVRRIQEFSRMRADDENFVSIDMNELVEHSLEFTKVRWKSEAESKGITIRIRKELSSLPSVLGSASELREVLTNLINNAVDAVPQGGDIVIKTFAHGSRVCVEVRDTGIGIPGSIRDKIFDPFFTTKGPRSTGLGMSVSYGIITRHHGTISVESKEEEGTAFTITLPESEQAKEETRGRPRLAEEGRKARILVIEDEEAVRMLLNDILAAEGHEVCVCCDGKDGVEAFRKQYFDIVFTDLGMPGMSGWEVAKSLKSFDPGATVVLVTGWGIQLDERELATGGVDLVMNKPFGVEEIVHAAQEAMSRREQVKRE